MSNEQDKQRLGYKLVQREIGEGLTSGELRATSDSAIDYFLSEYGRDEDEYLVDGAVLKCTNATIEAQEIEIDGKMEKFECLLKGDRLQKQRTCLKVFDNGAETNKKTFATIMAKDVAKRGKKGNIRPFQCNCIQPPCNNEDLKELKEFTEAYKRQGTCAAFIKLEDNWENAIKQTRYCQFPHAYANGKLYSEGKSVEGVTMASVLFCSHGGFIYPLTSGQCYQKSPWDALTDEEREFAETYGFTEEQCKALINIREYLSEYPELGIGTSIFAFEGLGEDRITSTEKRKGQESWNGENDYHKPGQFKAILIVTKNGKLSYAELYASTLPDNMETAATICEGIYYIEDVEHGADLENNIPGYAAVNVLTNDEAHSGVLPAYNSIHGNGTADGVHLHMAGPIRSNNPERPYSRGCITLPVVDYREFSVQTGFVLDLESNKNAGSNGVYADAKTAFKYSENAVKDFEGHMVIDRRYYDDVNGYLKFKGSEGNAGNEKNN